MTDQELIVPRDLTFDVARGLAMVAVVLSHVLGGLYDSGTLDSIPAWSDEVTRGLYLSHLPVFAFVTGLLMPRSVEKRGRSTYLWRRLLLILYLYLVWTLVQGAVEVFSSPWKNFPTTWSRVFAVWWPLGQLWFLPTLAICTAAVVLVMPWRRTRAAWVGTVLVLAGGLAVWGWGYPVAGAQGLALIVWFTAGALLTAGLMSGLLGRARGPLLWGLAVLGAIGLVVIASADAVTMPTLVDPNRTPRSVLTGVAGTGLAVIVVLSLSSLLARCPRFANPAAHVGRMSLHVYLAHVIFAAGGRVILTAAGVSDLWLLALLCTTAGVAGPLLLEAATRRTPWLFTPPWETARRL